MLFIPDPLQKRRHRAPPYPVNQSGSVYRRPLACGRNASCLGRFRSGPRGGHPAGIAPPDLQPAKRQGGNSNHKGSQPLRRFGLSSDQRCEQCSNARLDQRRHGSRGGRDWHYIPEGRRIGASRSPVYRDPGNQTRAVPVQQKLPICGSRPAGSPPMTGQIRAMGRVQGITSPGHDRDEGERPLRPEARQAASRRSRTRCDWHEPPRGQR